MSSIITITFSPCIDKSTSIPALVAEKKLHCSNPKLEPGGGGINVARVIHKLGGNVMAVFPSGGYTGTHFNYLLEKEQIPCSIIHTENETRENIIVYDESTGNQYRFGMPGTALKETEWKECLQVIEESANVDYIVASGSLPPGVPTAVFSLLAKIAQTKKARFIADTSGDALKEAAETGAFLLKPNLGELASLAGKKMISTDEIETVAKQILQQYPVEILVVSAGADGAMLFTKNETHKAVAPQVDRKSTVGAGDSMVAGIIFSLSQQSTLKQALQFGVACGTAATINPGTELCNPSVASMLYDAILASEK
jgi:6-phosphofructokinase 2